MKMVNRTGQRTELCVIAWRNSSSKLTVNFNPDITSWHAWVVLGLQTCSVGHSHSVWFLDGMSLPRTRQVQIPTFFEKAGALAPTCLGSLMATVDCCWVTGVLLS